MKLKRVIAFVLDLTIYFFGFEAYLNVKISDSITSILNLHFENVFQEFDLQDNIRITTFVFYFLLFEVLFFTSPGKWLFNLKIKSYETPKPKRLHVLVRAFLKMASCITIIGGFVNLAVYIANGYCWYDKILGLYISDNRNSSPHQEGLTETQKNWREHFKQ